MRASSVVSQNSVSTDLRPDTKHIVACVDNSENAKTIAAHAFAIANALSAPVTLLQVLEPPSASVFRPDPIEWNIRRHDSWNALKWLADTREDGVKVLDTKLFEGQPAEEICRGTADQAGGLIVLGTNGERAPGKYCIGSTVRNVLEKADCSVLLVPVSSKSASAPHYRKILVPLDGSSWSESVMPLAARLAHATDAELILAHIVPTPELTETDPLEAEDFELRERIVDRNERVAQSYLDRIRGYVAMQGLKVRALILRGGDVRSSLISLIGSENVDLVVFSARGHGHHRISDVPYGHVVAYLVTHSSVPMLIVRSTETPSKIYIAPQREIGRTFARRAV